MRRFRPKRFEGDDENNATVLHRTSPQILRVNKRFSGILRKSL